MLNFLRDFLGLFLVFLVMITLVFILIVVVVSIIVAWAGAIILLFLSGSYLLAATVLITGVALVLTIWNIQEFRREEIKGGPIN